MPTSLVESGPRRLAKRLRGVGGAFQVGRRARNFDRRFRGNAGCRRIERSGARMAWVCGAAEVVKNCSFGGHGRGFVGCHLTIGSSDHGAHLRWAKEGIDDWDKSASLAGNASPRRSTSSLDAMREARVRVCSSADAPAVGIARCVSQRLRSMLTSLVESGSLRSTSRLHRVGGSPYVGR
jgi:hypothetical protein